MLGSVLHDQGVVASILGQYDRAIPLLYRALEYNVNDQDPILGDTGLAYLLTNRFHKARQILSMVALTADNQLFRWTATQNLLYGVILEEQQSSFDLYRTALQFGPLPPQTEMSYRLDLALGHRTFRNYTQAQIELSRAHALAEQYQIHLGYWI